MQAEREKQWDMIEELKKKLAEKNQQEAVVAAHESEQDGDNKLDAMMNMIQELQQKPREEAKKMDAIMEVIKDLSGRLDQQAKEAAVAANTEVHRWRFVDGIPDKMRNSILKCKYINLAELIEDPALAVKEDEKLLGLVDGEIRMKKKNKEITSTSQLL